MKQPLLIKAPLLFLAGLSLFLFVIIILPSRVATGEMLAQQGEPTKPATTPTAQPKGASPASGTWVLIKSETFEGVFPSTGFSVVDLSGDGYERFWDDDNYRPHNGSWAGWPARGGANGLNPAPGNDNYFNNMNTLKRVVIIWPLRFLRMASTLWSWRVGRVSRQHGSSRTPITTAMWATVQCGWRGDFIAMPASPMMGHGWTTFAFGNMCQRHLPPPQHARARQQRPAPRPGHRQGH